MFSYTIKLNYSSPDDIYKILEILKRMGWQYDEPDEEMCVRVNVPVDDIELFNFIMNS